MQDIKLTIDGKEQTLNAEQMESISKMFPKDEWARKAKGETYWIINNDGEQTRLIDSGDIYDVAYYSVGNYYPTEHIAEMRSLDWQLNNLLFRYSMQHGGDDITASNDRFYLLYSFQKKEWFYVTEVCEAAVHGQIYFSNSNVAQSAIREVVEPFCREHPGYLDWLRGDKR